MMDIKELEQQWLSITSQYSADPRTIDILNHLIKNYSSPKRHYHNLTHIANMLQIINYYKEKLEDFDAVFFAAWFHDVIYSSMKSDNEEKSAEVAEECLLQIGFPEERTEKVKAMILATKNHMSIDPIENFDTKLFLDADLKILGADRDDYINYMKNVRTEYKHVPLFMYKPARKKVLQKFLEMEFIYRTEAFKALFEEKARENLKFEISHLSLKN